MEKGWQITVISLVDLPISIAFVLEKQQEMCERHCIHQATWVD